MTQFYIYSTPDQTTVVVHIVVDFRKSMWFGTFMYDEIYDIFPPRFISMYDSLLLHFHAFTWDYRLTGITETETT